MAETGGTPMTRQELVEFAQKLEAWGQSLTAKEQGFLEELLARAMAPASGEVEGFMITTLRKPDVLVNPSSIEMNPINVTSIESTTLSTSRFSGLLLGEM